MRTNYAAVIVAAIAYWILGAIWYAALFGKQWVALEGITEAQMKGANPVLPYVITLLLNLLIAYSLAQVCIGRSALVDWIRGAGDVHNVHVRIATVAIVRDQPVLSAFRVCADGRNPRCVDQENCVKRALTVSRALR